MTSLGDQQLQLLTEKYMLGEQTSIILGIQRQDSAGKSRSGTVY